MLLPLEPRFSWNLGVRWQPFVLVSVAHELLLECYRGKHDFDNAEAIILNGPSER